MRRMLAPGVGNKGIHTLREILVVEILKSYNGRRSRRMFGCKIIQAEPMDECTFLKTVRGQECRDRETQPGYKVIYPDGYVSWSPQRVFEEAYRPISEKEKMLV